MPPSQGFLTLTCFQSSRGMDTVSRKRPASPVATEAPTAKKRALNSVSGSPSTPPNAELPDENERDPQAETLETFRKQALFKRMRQHERERKRAEGRVAELEQRKRTLQASLSAIENCWNHTVDQLQTIAKVDSLQQHIPSDIIDLRALIEREASKATGMPKNEFRDALRADGVKTQNLVSAFVAMVPPRPTPDAQEMAQRLQLVTAEATSLRSQLHAVCADYTDVRDQLDRYKELLARAETQGDGARFESLKRKEDKSMRHEEIKAEGGSSHQTPEPLVQSTPHINGTSEDYSAEIALLRSQAEKREEEITRLAEQKAEISAELCAKNAKIDSFSEEYIWVHPTYKALLEEVSSLRETSEALQRAQKAAQQSSEQRLKELQSLIDEQRALFDTLTREHDERIKAKNQQIAKAKDQREAALKDLAIAKAGEASRSSLREKMETRMVSLEDRIASLLLETKRLKLQLGAQYGQDDYLSFMLSKPDESVSLIDDLRSKLSMAQTRVSALESAFSKLEDSASDVAMHMRAEAAARQECVQLRRRLAEFQSLFGEQATADVAKLSAIVKEKEQTIKSMRLAQQQEAAVSNDLYDELARMSSAWEILDRESKTRQDETATWESKVNKLSVEKAKAEQKFFAAMREKEAIDAERKAVLKNATKDAAIIAKFTEQEKLLRDAAAPMRLAIAGYQQQRDFYEGRLSAKESALHQKTVSLELLQKQIQGLESALNAAERETEANLQRSRKFEDELAQLQQSTSQEIARLKQASSVSSATTQREEELKNEVAGLMSILRCSTCNQDFKSHVLLKCMHTFCKSCIDARLTTRQRKCPACNMKFQDSDVQALYFQ
ncbi:uncharacterized protein EI90DRAFT_3058592 [Cantharellus anzutake]|uniref:uncharacterized protein n=1 Tax=Cantharellus anzutake TaxID=1750568 RepID=UPI0019083DB2|nr:uncharacterized protein EI90DRAFT_3058592 [Cantharellus anzutake]KAF8331113.1 hypothetical protein EI90DRAFT_3058592 [Cantharellus anzutake]